VTVDIMASQGRGADVLHGASAATENIAVHPTKELNT
jgi:hypothetical protein